METLPEFPVCLACSVDFRLKAATLTWMSSLLSCPWISDLPGLTIVWRQFLNIYVIYHLFIYLHTQLSTYYIYVYICVMHMYSIDSVSLENANIRTNKVKYMIALCKLESAKHC